MQNPELKKLEQAAGQRDSSGNKLFQSSNSPIKRMLERHRKILDLHLAGLKNKQVAELCGVTPVSVSRIVNSPVFQAELSRRRESKTQLVDEGIASSVIEAKRLIEESAASAARTEIDLLRDDSPSIRHRASESILDRVFAKASGEQSARVAVLNIEQVNLLQVALKESGRGDSARKLVDSLQEATSG